MTYTLPPCKNKLPMRTSCNIEPDHADIRLLQQLVEQRRQLVEDTRRFVNRIINTLKQYYPQPLEWFSHRVAYYCVN